MLKLTLADFQAALPISTKIEDGALRPFVDQSLRLDLTPLLGFAVLEGVAALPEVSPTRYEDVTVVTAGQYVVRRERVFRALVTAPVLPPPIGPDPAGVDSSGQWAYQPLLTLWTQYLKPYWLAASFDRFAPQHGLDFTKAGVTVPTDPKGTFTQPSAAARAALQASLDTTTDALRSLLTAFLRTETLAYRQNRAFGYDYGQPTSGCATTTPSARPGRLRGINTSRRPRF